MYIKKIGNRYNKNPRGSNNYNKDTSVEFPISEEPKKVIGRPPTRSKRQTKPKTRAERVAAAQQRKKSSGGSSRTMFFIFAMIAYGLFQFADANQIEDFFNEVDNKPVWEEEQPAPRADEPKVAEYPSEVEAVVSNEILTAESNPEIELQAKIETSLTELKEAIAKNPNGMKELEPLSLLNFISINTTMLFSAKLRPAFVAQKKAELLLSLYDLDLSAKVYDRLYESMDFSGANLQNANLENAYLVGINLSDADLSHANLTGANIVDANFEGTNLEGTILPE